jgi:transcriptional regulator with XRE-family HTH domain
MVTRRQPRTTVGSHYSAILSRVAANVRRLRQEQAISQEEAAHRAGLPLRVFQRCEKGQTNFTAETLARLAVGLKTEPRDLLAAADP